MATGRQFGNLEGGDIAVIVIYFVGIMAVGCWTISKSKSDLSNFFLAGRAMTWWPIGMSLFASNIGSINFVGISGSAAATGLAVVMFEWNAIWLLMLLGWVFLPVYIGSGIYTMPEYLWWRFGGSRLRVYLSVIAIVTSIVATVSPDLFSGAIFINQTLGWNIYGGSALLLGVSLLFSALGGLETVIITDAFAVVIMVCGGAVLMIVGFIKVGGMSGLEHKYMRAIPDWTLEQGNTTCGYPRDDAFHIFRDVNSELYPSLGTFLRTTFGSLWYWCANQVLVQRALAAKNMNHAKGGTVLAGFLKLTPLFIMVFPGMISRALFPNEVACADPETCSRVCDTPAGCSNIALPKLVVELLPQGVRGLLVASMMAAVISSLTSIFNSSTTLFTVDIWGKLRPNASVRELLFVGRIFVVILAGLSVIWIPVMQNAKGGQIYVYATIITGYMGAPTCAMFVLAMFWPRINEKGAFYGMIIAQAWGILRFILDFMYPAPACGEEETRPGFIKDFHPYYHTVSQVALAFLVAAVLSLLTKRPPKERLAGLTFWSRKEKPLKDELYEKMMEERTALRQEDIEMNGKSDEPLSPEEFTTRMGLKKRIVNRLCGTNERKQHTSETYILEPHSVRLQNLKQEKFWRYLLNASAVLLMTTTTFCYAWWR